MTDFICCYCGKDATVLDHFVPVSRGGTDNRDNLWPSCERCNSSKRAYLLEEWRAVLAFRSKYPPSCGIGLKKALELEALGADFHIPSPETVTFYFEDHYIDTPAQSTNENQPMTGNSKSDKLVLHILKHLEEADKEEWAPDPEFWALFTDAALLIDTGAD